MKCALRAHSKTKLTLGTLANPALNRFVNEAVYTIEAQTKVSVGSAEANAPGVGAQLVKDRARHYVQSSRTVLTPIPGKLLPFHPLDAELRLFDLFALSYLDVFDGSLCHIVVSEVRLA